METILLENKTPDGKVLHATFAPENGMNLLSFKKDEVEIIDQNTKEAFEDHAAGLGPLIGPHFHIQKQELQGEIPDESKFPHIERMRVQGKTDPFTHGIARYAPWDYKSTSTKIQGKLQGKDKWSGVALSKLEGIDFTMTFSAELLPDGLHVAMSVECERPSIVGLHYYYALAEGKGLVKALVENEFNDMGNWKPLPEKWWDKEAQCLVFDLSEEADYGFRPLSNDHSGRVMLETSNYQLRIGYQAENEEHSWQLYSPKDASFVCIEPLSAKNPRDVVQNSSKIKIHIEIL